VHGSTSSRASRSGWGFQTFGIIFGEPNYPGSTLDRLADGKVCTVRDLTCAEDIRSIFRGIS
jgi:hypothetical protein